MSIRTTVSLDEDVLERIREVSRRNGKSFRETLNALLREALLEIGRPKPTRSYEIKPFYGGPPRMDLDCTSTLLEEVEGPDWR